MIINLYIEVSRENQISEHVRLVALENMLRENGFAFYNATDFDPCTSGCNPLTTLENIELQIEGSKER